MREKWESLQLILERMNGLYERVHAVLGREKEALIRFDYENLYVAMGEKDELLAIMRGLDRDRLRLQDQYALVSNRKTEDVSLRLIADELVQAGGDAAKTGRRLLSLRSRMEVNIAELHRKVCSNEYFISKCLNNLRLMAENISAAVNGRTPESQKPKSSVYTGKAKLQKPRASSGSLVEKKF